MSLYFSVTNDAISLLLLFHVLTFFLLTSFSLISFISSNIQKYFAIKTMENHICWLFISLFSLLYFSFSHLIGIHIYLKLFWDNLDSVPAVVLTCYSSSWHPIPSINTGNDSTIYIPGVLMSWEEIFFIRKNLLIKCLCSSL